jgi:hypothetical protein
MSTKPAAPNDQSVEFAVTLADAAAAVTLRERAVCRVPEACVVRCAAACVAGPGAVVLE